jgi:hypothetical protein
MAKGSHNIIIDSEYPEEDTPKIEVQFKGINKSETIQILKK